MASSPNSYQKRKSSLPFILDDSFERLREEFLVSGIEEKHEGPLAETAIPEDLLSMSGYGKPQYTNGKEFESSRTMEEPLYLSYAQPGVGHHHIQHSHVPYTRGDQVTYAAGAIFQNRPLEEVPSQYASLRHNPIPEVSNWQPRQGPPGTQITIHFISAFELDRSWTFSASFGNHSTQCALEAVQGHDSYYHYDLITASPPTWNNSMVSLTIKAQDEMGNNIGRSHVGQYTYTGAISAAQVSSEVSRKRKLSPGSAAAGGIVKRTSPQQQSAVPTEDSYDRQAYPYDQAPTYLLHSAAGVEAPMTSNIPNSYSQQHEQDSQYQEATVQQLNQQLGNTSSLQPARFRGPSPQTPSWANSAAPPPPSRSPNISAASSRGAMGTASPPVTNPPLVRTSSLQQSPSPSSTPTGASASGMFNPYAIYPHKATLRLQGDLNDMTKDWSPEEHTMQRRLVQFYRTQSESTIHATFKAVTPEERQTNTICISCIWWEAKGECYVTSVDTIALLEALVAVRFCTPEKNRIRRNLEGFRPLTVSKGKPDSEDFFKLVMGFPNPKPRNIEKDVKAFPWKTLDHALKKIISKYSASYSSTVDTIPSSRHAPQHGSYQPELTREPTHTSAPYAVPDAAMNGPYAHGMPLTITNLPPGDSNSRMPVPYTTDGSAALQSAHTPEYPLYQYPTSHIGQNTGLIPMMASQEHPPQQHQHRTPWELGQYLEHPTSSANEQALYAMPSGHETGHYSVTHASSGA